MGHIYFLSLDFREPSRHFGTLGGPLFFLKDPPTLCKYHVIFINIVFKYKSVQVSIAILVECHCHSVFFFFKNCFEVLQF